MTNVTDKFLDYGVNASTAYGTNNSATAPVVNGWKPVEVTRFTATSTGFAAQLYTDGAGHYRVAMRGTDGKDDVPPDWALATGQWHPQLTDAVRFMGEAILQIKRSDAGRDLTLDQIRANLDGSGHSLGGALYELSAKFWGTAGMNIDGPGVTAQLDARSLQISRPSFATKG